MNIHTPSVTISLIARLFGAITAFSLLTSCMTPQAPAAATATAAKAVVSMRESTAPKEGAVPSAPTTPADRPTPTVPSSAAAAMAAALGGAPGEPRKYDTVITKDAKTSRGVVLYHKVKDKHYFELPEKLLGRDLLWSVEMSQSSAGAGFNGLPLGYRVVRFERVENRILMRSVSYRNRGTPDLQAAIDATDLAPIVMAFQVEAEGNERSVELRAEEKRLLEQEKADKEKAEKLKIAKEKAEKEGKPFDEKAFNEELAAAAKAKETTTAKDSTETKIEAAKEKMKVIIDAEIAKKNAAEESKVAEVATKVETKVDAKTDTKVAPKDAAKDTPKEDKKPEARKDVAEKRPEPKEKWAVIDISRLFLTTSNDLVDGRNLGPMGFGGIDPTRSLIGQVRVFPENVEVRSTVTFSSVPFPQMAQGGMPQMPSVTRNPTKTAILHTSLALLPEKPMQGRFFDERVGYFTEPFLEYGGERSGVREREYITRFRLEKKDPTAAVSEPVKPITFYIAQEVPEKWRKALIAGVEDWKPMFEAAGFKNAIVAKMAPTKTEDPNWDAEDARHSVIRWVAMPVANAMGPHVHDPRSGEIISAHVIFWHDLLSFLERMYFVQAGAADVRVTTLPISDEIMAEMLRGVATHEVGHTLGLRHNHRAATAYSVKDLRNPVFTRTNGTNASIMSYGRFNSVAQPGDGVTSFVPKLGAYDEFAITWGYKPLGKKTADEERTELDHMAARQINEPLLKFGGEDFAAMLDPEVQTENIGRERIEATRLSVQSLERAANKLIPATTKLGEDYDLLESTYFQLISQRSRYINSVVKLIGGVRETRFLGGRGGDTFVRTTPQEQRQAIQYLLDEALSTPRWLTDPKLLNRISMIDVTGPVVNSQKRILGEMLQPIRFRVLEDAESLAAGSGMTASAYLGEVQKSVFREIAQPHPKVDIYRRELQREYVDHLRTFSGELQRFKSFGMMISSMLTDLTIDLRPAAMQGMKDLKRDLDSAERRATDTPTRLHFAQLSREIEKILKIRSS